MNDKKQKVKKVNNKGRVAILELCYYKDGKMATRAEGTDLDFAVKNYQEDKSNMILTNHTDIVVTFPTNHLSWCRLKHSK
jgi:hypothetical protein